MKNSVSVNRWLLASLLVVLLMPSGCSKKEMDEMVSKAKDSATEFKEKSGDVFDKAKSEASDAAATIREKTSELKEKTSEAVTSMKDSATKLTSETGNRLAMNGSAQMTLDVPVKFPASYVRLVPLADGPFVVQLKSYADDGQSDTYPAFFLQGIASHPTIDALNGQSVPCRLYAQKTAGGDVWTNVADQLVNVQFHKSQNKMTARFTDATLVNTANNQPSVSSGSFECANLD